MKRENKSIDKEKVGQRIKELREKFKLKWTTVAEGIGISRSGYSTIESGTYAPGHETFMAIKDFYSEHYGTKVLIDWLYGYDDSLDLLRKIDDTETENSKNNKLTNCLMRIKNLEEEVLSLKKDKESFQKIIDHLMKN